jgi:hypothetical protein
MLGSRAADFVVQGPAWAGVQHSAAVILAALSLSLLLFCA